MEAVESNSNHDTITTTVKPTQIFILSGQSNMAGRGGVTHTHPKKWDGFLPPECKSDQNILRFNSHHHWEVAHEPLHFDIDSKKTCGVGPGLVFAKSVRVVLDPDVVVGLVPCAVGGTAIKEWERGCHLYENMVKRAKEAVKGGGEIKGLLWYQGESDTLSQQLAKSYKTNMETFIHNVRSDLLAPLLPIIQVALASGDEPWIETVREAQLGMKMENVVCVDAKGLPLLKDNLHLTTEAQVKLGNILAEAYISHFVNSSCP